VLGVDALLALQEELIWDGAGKVKRDLELTKKFGAKL